MPGAKVTDKTIRVALAKVYPKEIWYFLASFIIFLSLVHFASLLLARLTRRPAPSSLTSVVDPEGGTTDLEGVKFDWSFYSNRAGTLAASQFPLITVLGTKNNVLTLLTGISYEKMNNLHRMSARVLLVLLWLHAGSKVSVALSCLPPIIALIYPPTNIPCSITPDEIGTTWLNLGYVSVFAFSALVLVSLRPVRAVAYEFFFYMHFILAFLILLGAYYHTVNFNFQQYVWPSFLVWGLDRFIRLIRVVVFKLSPHLSSASDPSVTARADLLAPDLVRLRVPRPPGFSWSPGQLSYIIMPGVSRLPFEAHPFSIASVHDGAMDGGNGEKGGEHWKEVVFLINAQSGFTKRLAHAAQSGEAKVNVLLDGPYGCSPDLDGSDTVVLVAGGTGISYTLPLLLSVAKKGRARRVLFIWSIRDSSHLRWVSPAIIKALSLAPASMSISVSIHITRLGIESPPNPLDIGSSPMARSEESLDTRAEKTVDLLHLRAVQVSYGRPDFQRLVHTELEGAEGHTSVCVCGSQSIAKNVRSSLRVNPFAGPNSVLKGAPSVTLHVEAFGYA
ncbi:hypothetical protein GLOTRDRAFT_44599 [Gloeophyllum trabeum ATCC 11539]|uniref:ferric-chelate reductase (NADPH) n=1 Tax=Gloeophyllum trabeum (strain ATCC 11539 / FP-39264 / Madison 617) TaxID=670483 RepID=S7Q3L5_GLOTA|nr:uncharacterized protein GLOTRDRAFT_44599 [Gloeophyllum trabeum ATCC 11539]EPQ54152.1 hypothetical protein GLOTRDRAFT_44599 [Gloeophyllum trabeum ATCC 11539]